MSQGRHLDSSMVEFEQSVIRRPEEILVSVDNRILVFGYMIDWRRKIVEDRYRRTRSSAGRLSVPCARSLPDGIGEY